VLKCRSNYIEYFIRVISTESNGLEQDVNLVPCLKLCIYVLQNDTVMLAYSLKFISKCYIIFIVFLMVYKGRGCYIAD